MRWFLVLLTVCVLANGFAPAAISAEPAGSMLKSLNTLNIEIILGRITLQAARYRHSRAGVQRDDRSKANESLSLQIQAGVPTLHYDGRDATRRLTFDVLNGDDVELQLIDLGSGTVVPLHFNQPRHGDVCLTIDASDGRLTYSAPSLWHLLLAHPDVCRDHLIPLLELLRSDWHLERQTPRVEEALLQVALDDLTLDRAEVLQLVGQLRAVDYRQRQQAMRQLTGCGLGVLPVLDSLDPQSLDAEQRHRIAQVRAEVRTAAGDSPERVASWLRCDRAMWLTLLASPQRKTSELAGEHLSRLYARPISIAHVASDQERARQVQRVRNQLERR